MMNRLKELEQYDPVSVDRVIRENWEAVLSLTEDGQELCEMIGYGFTEDDINNLREIHRDNPDLRKQVEQVFDGCGFDFEATALREGRYEDVEGWWKGNRRRTERKEWSEYQKSVWEMLEAGEQDGREVQGIDL